MCDIESVDELEKILEVKVEDKLINRRLPTIVDLSNASTDDEDQEPTKEQEQKQAQEKMIYKEVSFNLLKVMK